MTERTSRILNRQTATPINSPYSSFAPGFGGRVRIATQDQLLLTKGGSGPRALSLYLDLLTDGVISSSLSKQLNEITSREVIVEPTGDSDLDIKAADFVRYQLLNLQETTIDSFELGNSYFLPSDSSFDMLTKWHLLANIVNITPSEIVWQRTAKGLVGLDRINPVDPRRFVFEQPEDGQHVFPRLLTRSNNVTGDAIPSRKFIFHRAWNLANYDPLGSGLGSTLYWLVQWRREALTFWMGLLERHADPAFVGEVPANASQPQVDKFERDLSLFGRDTNMVVPSGFKISSPGTSGNAQSVKELIDWASEEISLVITGEATVGKPGGGSQARETINNSVRLALAASWSRDFDRTLRSTLVKWMVRWNFPGAGIPKVSRQFKDASVVLEIANSYKQLGLTADPEYIEDACGVPMKQKPPKKEAQPVPENLL